MKQKPILMSFETFVSEQLAKINDTLSPIVSNSKKIEELPPYVGNLPSGGQVPFTSAGNTYKIDPKSVIDKAIEAQITDSTIISGVTTSSPVPPTGNIHAIGIGPGTYPNWGGMVIPVNNLGTLQRVDGVYSVSLTPIALPTVINNLNSTSVIAALSANQGRILDEKKANLQVGKNIFNWEDEDVLLDALIGADGVIYQDGGSVGFIVTGFIPAVAGQQIVSNRTPGGFASNFYDANKVKLSTTTNSGVLAIPVGAFYLRKTIFLAGLGLQAAKIQIEIGSVSTFFEDYGLKIPLSELSASNIYDSESDAPVNSVAIKNAVDLNNDFWGEYKNLFNKVSSTTGKYVYTLNGDLFDNPDFSTSEFIPVESGESYYYNSGSLLGAYYSANNVYVSAIRTNVSVAPINAVFARVSYLTSFLNEAYFTKGTVPITYVPYAFKIKEEFIPTAPIVKYDNKIDSPLKQHFLSTIENNIYLAEFQKRTLQANPLKTEPAIGQVINNFIRATNPAIGTYAVNNQLMDLDYNVVDEKDFSIVVTNLSKTSSVNLLCIGDSYTDINTYVKEISAQLPNINHIGMCKTVAGTDVKREGRSGYSLHQYVNDIGVGTDFYFTPFRQPIAPYTYYGNTAFWKIVYDQSGPSYGYLTFVPWVTTLNINSAGVRATPNVNDVMYFTLDSVFKVWSGSAWNVISQATLNFSINITKYRSTWSIPTPNVVTILLGMNDFRYETPNAVNNNFPAWKSNMDLLIAGFKADNANVKFIIATCNSVQDYFRGGEGNAALWEVYKNIIEAYDNRESENIFISDTKSAVDRVYGFWGSNEKPFSAFSQTEKTWLGTNDIHCSDAGMKQIGQKLAATVQYVRP